MAALLGLTEQVVRILTRGQVYENVFLGNQAEDGDKLLQNLRDALIRIYVTSLELLADAESLFSQNTARQTLEAIINQERSRVGFLLLLLKKTSFCVMWRRATPD